jgi:hypothetical protein
MPTPSESFVAAAREQFRQHELETFGWWFDARLPVDEPVRVVELPSGLRVPSPVVMHVELARQPSIELRIETDEDDIRVTGVTIVPAEGAADLTATALRLPFKKVIDEARRRLALLAIFQDLDDYGRFVTYPGDGSIEPRAGVLKDRRRRLIDDELLEKVGEAVREGDRARPNEAVRERLHTSQRNASRWIAEAKRRGFLKEEDDGGE